MEKPHLSALSWRLGLFTALVSLTCTASVLAQSVWTGGSDNEFSKDANWTPAAPRPQDSAVVATGSPQVTDHFVITELDVTGGNVTITDTGELTVTGGTTVTSGSLGINAGGVLNSDVDLNGGGLSVDGDLNGRLTVNAGGVSVNGMLGSAVVGAAGTLANNGKAGDVEVSSGGILVNNSGAIAGAVINSGDASNAGTIASLENRAGNFTNNDGGRITGLTAVAGGTVTNNFVITDADVSAGATFVNNNGATAGAVTNSGTATNAGTIASLRNDAGGFTNNDGGRITGLTTAAGGTVTNNSNVGAVEVLAAGTFVNNIGASAGTVTNAGNASNAGTIASLRNDAGTFTNNDGGTVMDSTTVTGGAVVNNAWMRQVSVEENGAFVNNSGAFAADVWNTGAGSNDGTIGRLVGRGGLFSNTGTIVSLASISGGSLVNEGTIEGQVFIHDGGTLSGGGDIGSLLVQSGGTFAPGPGTQAVAIAGDAVFEAGSAYRVDVDANGFASRFDSGGAVTINGGALEIRAAEGRYGLETDYTILTGSSVTGSFDTVTSGLAFLSPILTYETNGVELGLYRNDVDFSEVTDTANSRATANAVQSLGPLGPLFLDVLTLDADTAALAFPQLSGEAHASLKSAMLRDSRFPRDAIIGRMMDEETEGTGVWTAGFASSGHFSGDGNAMGLGSETAGFVAGADMPLSDEWRAGGLLGYSRTQAGGQADVQSGHAGLYAAGDIGALDFVGGALYSFNEVSTYRRIAFGPVSQRLTADYGSGTAQMFADLSWAARLEGIELRPFANLAYVDVRTDAFRETGGSAALSAAGGSDDVTFSTLGLRWSADLPFGNLPIDVSGMFGWRHAFGDVTPAMRFAFTGGIPFEIGGVALARNTAVIEAGATARLSKTARLSVSYAGEFGGGSEVHSGRVKLAVSF